MTRLALREVPLDEELSSEGVEFHATSRGLLETGNSESPLEFFMHDMPREWVESSRNSPVWPVIISIAPSLLVDTEALAWTQSGSRPKLWADVRVPVRVLLGEQPPPSFSVAADSLVAALPDAHAVRVPGACPRWEPDPTVQVLADFCRA